MPSRKSSKPEQIALGFDPEAMLVAGVDEAGRGPLAGPVVAAAVILDDCRRIRGLADSKVLPPARRERLFDEIRAKALAFCIAEASVDEIDTLNILQATLLAMKRAVEGLRLAPHKVLVDGNQLPRLRVRCEAIVGGDARVKSISAASILAKVTRDQICREHEERYPLYGFAEHKGYCTPQHLAALMTHGPCPWHRRSFAPVREAALQRATNPFVPDASAVQSSPAPQDPAHVETVSQTPVQVQVQVQVQVHTQVQLPVPSSAP